jgi:Domain of unknown function (DUF5668)
VSDNASRSASGARCDHGQIIWGLTLVTIGAAFLAQRMEWIRLDNPFRLWPAVFIAMGLGSLLSGGQGSLLGAFSFFWMGTIFFLHNFDVVGLQDSWPLFIVLAGITTTWKALAPPRPTRVTGAAGAEKHS